VTKEKKCKIVKNSPNLVTLILLSVRRQMKALKGAAQRFESRVTRLGEFSPIGRLSSLGSF
jgi:hypothetical protein